MRGDVQARVAERSRMGDEQLEKTASQPAMLQFLFNAEGDFASRRVEFRTFVQFSGAEHASVLDIAQYRRDLLKAATRIFLQESIADGAVEAITPAFTVKPEEMVAKQAKLRRS